MDSKSGNDATNEHKGGILANFIMITNQFKLKQTWVAEIGLNVLYHSIHKDSDNDISFLLKLEIKNERMFSALSKKALSDVLKVNLH